MYRVERTAEASEQRVSEALNDPNILTMKLGDVMKKYHINYANAKRAVKTATLKAVKNSKSPEQVLHKVDVVKQVRRIRSHLLRAESNYPGILRMVINGDPMRTVGDYFGLRGERCRQIKKELIEYAETVKKPITEVCRSLTKDAD